MSIANNLVSQINLHETVTTHSRRSHVSLPFNPISCFPINKVTVAPLTTTNTATRWDSMIVYANVDPAGVTPPPSGSPWKNWVIGLLITFIVPIVTTNGGPIKFFLKKLDQIVDVVGAVADKVDKVAEEIGDDLPESSRIKKTLDFIEQVAERVEKDAENAGDFIDKVQEMEGKMEDIMEPVLEEAKEVDKQADEKEKAKKQ